MTKKYMTVHPEQMEKKTRLGMGQHFCGLPPHCQLVGDSSRSFFSPLSNVLPLFL